VLGPAPLIVADRQRGCAAGCPPRIARQLARAVLSDIGRIYHSHAVADGWRTHYIAQQFARPYRRQTNSKAERFIRTLLLRMGLSQACGRLIYRKRALAT
jgi:transposase InsO family protein